MRHLAKHRPALLPALLIVLGVCLLQGCLYIPTFNATVGGKDAEKLVGPGKPLQAGISTREQVKKVLGQPFSETSDGRFVVYSWLKRKGLLVYPFCFTAEPQDRSFATTFEFDTNGLLVDYATEEGPRVGFLFSPATGHKFIPQRVMIHQQELRLQNHPELLKRFRTATRPAPAPPGPQYRTTPSQ